MLDFSRVKNYYIACGYTDMRKQIDGLAALVQTQFGQEMDETSLYLFCGRQADRIKAWYWDGTGYILLYKRLTEKRFRKKFEFARVKAGVLRGFYYLDPDWSKDEREQPRASSSFCRRSKISIAPPPFCIYFTVSNNGKIQYACAE